MRKWYHEHDMRHVGLSWAESRETGDRLWRQGVKREYADLVCILYVAKLHSFPRTRTEDACPYVASLLFRVRDAVILPKRCRCGAC